MTCAAPAYFAIITGQAGRWSSVGRSTTGCGFGAVISSPRGRAAIQPRGSVCDKPPPQDAANGVQSRPGRSEGLSLGAMRPAEGAEPTRGAASVASGRGRGSVPAASSPRSEHGLRAVPPVVRSVGAVSAGAGGRAGLSGLRLPAGDAESRLAAATGPRRLPAAAAGRAEAAGAERQPRHRLRVSVPGRSAGRAVRLPARDGGAAAAPLRDAAAGERRPPVPAHDRLHPPLATHLRTLRQVHRRLLPRLDHVHR